MAGLFILTGYQGVEFNCFHKAYWEYNSFVFLKFGKYKKYKKVEKLFISTSATRQKIYTRVTEGTTVKREEFNASLKFDDGTKVFLSSKKDKDLLVRQVRRLSNFFQLEISETTN